MFTMFAAICPICGGHVVAIQDKPGLYLCQHCHVETEDKNLKLVPTIRSTNAKTNEFDSFSAQEGTSKV